MVFQPGSKIRMGIDIYIVSASGGVQAVLAMTVGIWLGISAELSIVLQHASTAWAASPAQVGLPCMYRCV